MKFQDRKSKVRIPFSSQFVCVLSVLEFFYELFSVLLFFPCAYNMQYGRYIQQYKWQGSRMGWDGKYFLSWFLESNQNIYTQDRYEAKKCSHAEKYVKIRHDSTVLVFEVKGENWCDAHRKQYQINDHTWCSLFHKLTRPTILLQQE